VSNRLRLWTRLFCVEAVRALARHKARTGLSALGITIGVAAVIWAAGIGEAGAARARQALEALGDNFVWIEAGSRNVAGLRTGSHGMTTLLPQDAEAIRRELPLVKSVSENVDGTVQLARGDRNWGTRYRGISPDYADIKRWRLARGAFFIDHQVTHAESVVVIGETVRQRLFGEEDALGQIVRVNAFPFVVIGVLAPKGQTPTGQDQDDTVLMPWTAAQRKLRGRNVTWLDDIVCSAVSNEAVDHAIADITSLLRQRHGIPPGGADDFNVRRPDEALKAQVQASQTLEALLLVLASISLVIGGIGIMNVMLASVLQRTNEIGVRIAVGATPRAVQLQFLGEAVMLGLFGGAMGVLLSAAGAFAFADVLGWRVEVPWHAAVLAVVCSVSVGVLSGVYPAWKASRLDPIAALRAE
jgi:putative ABC transport system permease protein